MPTPLDPVELMLSGPGAPFTTQVLNRRGVSYLSWKNAPGNLSEVFAGVSSFSTREYLVFESSRLTYGDVADRVARLRGALSSSGVSVGDRVALAMRNFPEWVIGFWAVTTLGAIVVPLNSWWSVTELGYGLRDSGAVLLLADRERADRVAEISAVPTWIVEESGQGSFTENVLAGPPREAAMPDPDTPAAIFYTSGTTGGPKGVILTHRNCTSALFNALYLGAKTLLSNGVDPSAPRPQAVNLVSIPLFHVTGCLAIMLPATATGAKLVLTRSFEPLMALRLIETERVTAFGGVPTVVRQILQHSEFASFDTSSVEVVSYGGAPSEPELVRQIERKLPAALPGNGYGLTETSGIAVLHNGESYRQRPWSCGRPVPVVEIRIAEPKYPHCSVSVGAIGELMVKGPTVFEGYWGREGLADAVLEEGWFRTGDLAKVDADGFVSIVDRIKDLIIRGGENVATGEVEAAIFEYPGVRDVAVVGVADPVVGEEVAAVVQLDAETTIDPELLRSFLATRLAAFKIPRYLVIGTEALPRNAAGKLLKRQLRETLGTQANS
ncbi:MAG: class I adenylate-forming enzyme family protein [Ferrimicrobium sp.]